MPHTDAQILSRKLGLGPIGSAKIKELSMPAHNEASDLTETTRVAAARTDAGAIVSNLAPVASPLSPPIATGASLFVPCHANPTTKGKP
jgi:hypothetical protein